MIFLRHPTPEVASGTCYGRTDLDIAEIGLEQIASALRDTPPLTRIIASPALRCRKLALSLAERDGIEPVFEERLWEMDMGEFEGMLWKDIPRDKSEIWFTDPENLPTPGGESFADVRRRVSDAVEEHLGSDTATTGFVCHAGPIRAMWMHWEGLTFRQAFDRTPQYATPVRILPPAR